MNFFLTDWYSEIGQDNFIPTFLHLQERVDVLYGTCTGYHVEYMRELYLQTEIEEQAERKEKKGYT